MKALSNYALLVSTLISFASPLQADDIEVFAGPSFDGESPNILVVMDNGANFSANVSSMRCSISPDGVVETDPTKAAFSHPTHLDGTAAAVQQCALYGVLKKVSDSSEAQEGDNPRTFNFGVMGFNATNLLSYDPEQNEYRATDCPSNTGGCLIMPMVDFNKNRNNILEWIRNWSKAENVGVNITSNNSANGATMQESWAYYAGRMGVSGRNYAGMAPASSICSRSNYVIFIGNAYRNNSTAGDGGNDANTPLKPLLGTHPDSLKNASPAATADEKALYSGSITTQCGTSVFPGANQYESRGYYALNWANYMKRQGITTYSVGILGPTCNAEYAAHLRKLGQRDVGGGASFSAMNFEELTVAFGTIFSEILSVDSAFASVSLPVSVSTQGTYLNQVYIGMFRPDPDFKPRWAGNLKQYRLAMVDGSLRLVDAREPAQSAISASGTGFISECARSYWTPSSTDSYWGTVFGAPNCVGFPAASNSPDGNLVEKGGQAFRLRGVSVTGKVESTSNSRNVLTCKDAQCANGLGSFSSSNAFLTSSSPFIGMSSDDRNVLIDWVRGANNKGDEFRPVAEMRPSVHGDIIHSRPVAINYGADDGANRNVVVFYGGNDGMLRAINGNRDDGADIGGVPPGGELWAFAPPESFGVFERRRSNTPPIYYPGTSVTAAKPNSYGFDGTVTSFVSGSKKMIYATMRRGGRMVYALDVSLPGSPSVAWRAGCPNNLSIGGTVSDEGCTDGMNGMGQAWSAPVLFKAAGYKDGDGNPKPLVIFGGGYDVCEDFDNGVANNNCSVASKGRHVFVMDAVAGGAPLKVLDTDRPVVGDVTLVFDKVTGLATYAYLADLGGNVYRIDIGGKNPADLAIVKIAAVGCDTASSCNPNRKLMFQPDVVEEFGTYHILIGSGDREKPLSTYGATTAVQNYFFMLKDRPSDPSWLKDECGAGINYLCLTSLWPVTDSNSTMGDPYSKKGWFLSLQPMEQVVTSAITTFGTAVFSTNIPYVKPEVIKTIQDCKPSLGTANVYSVRYLDASSANGTDKRYLEIDGGGLPPSPVAGKVILDDGTTVPFIIGANPRSPLDSGEPKFTGLAIDQPRARVYRYIQK